MSGKMKVDGGWVDLIPPSELTAVFLRARLLWMLRALDARDRFIIVKRFGLDGPALTLAQVGYLLGITKERARQLQIRALRNMGFRYVKHHGIYV